MLEAVAGCHSNMIFKSVVVIDFLESKNVLICESFTTVSCYAGNSRVVHGLPEIDLTTQVGALTALDNMTEVSAGIARERATIAAFQSRVEVGLSMASSQAALLGEAANRILSADVAEEVSNMLRLQILANAASAIIAQANQSQSLVLTLLQIN